MGLKTGSCLFSQRLLISVLRQKTSLKQLIYILSFNLNNFIINNKNNNNNLLGEIRLFVASLSIHFSCD